MSIGLKKNGKLYSKLMPKMNSKNKIFIDKLRSSGLRPTNQRVEISKFLFNRKKTFHFTV